MDLGLPMGLGDFDGDGIDDLFVQHRVAVDQLEPGIFLGARGFFDGAAVQSIELPDYPAGSMASFTASRIGDLDGDGRADAVLGAAQSTFVLSSRSPSRLVAVECAPSAMDTYCGLAAGPGGDVDGDGAADLLVLGHTTEFRLHGGVTILGEPIDTRPLVAETANVDGPTLASGGDLDGDGALDVATGRPFASRDAGVVQIDWGGEGARTDRMVGGTLFGDVVEMNGDLNGDGRSDLVVGGEAELVVVLMWIDGESAPRRQELHAPSATHIQFGNSLTTGR